LAAFSVGWYWGVPPILSNVGGHVLALLTADLSAGNVTINNSYPASFENVANLPSNNPQTVGIVAVPRGWTLPDLPPPSSNYTQVISQTTGAGESYAVLWDGMAWTISKTALPNSPGYAPSTWSITHGK
jgi:hypothetical protein